jgi:excisionase family DNA binding protein
VNPEVMTADEVAALMRCDRKTIYEAVLRKTIPHGRLGRRVFFSRAAIFDWLATKKST